MVALRSISIPAPPGLELAPPGLEIGPSGVDVPHKLQAKLVDCPMADLQIIDLPLAELERTRGRFVSDNDFVSPKPTRVRFASDTDLLYAQPARVQITCENDFLSAENARLALENQLLKQAMQAQYSSPRWPYTMASANHLSASLWQAQSSLVGDDYAAVPMREAEHGLAHRRARTDSDIPASIIAQVPQAQRMRSMSEIPGTMVDTGLQTTVILRNIPSDLTRTLLLDLLDVNGFHGQYDFVYVPMDFKTSAALGYGFVNLVNCEQAERVLQEFDGFARWPAASEKVCSTSWSTPHQGLATHIERYRNSPVLHTSVPDEFKPVVFQAGCRVAFPPPTKNIKAPRFRAAN